MAVLTRQDLSRSGLEPTFSAAAGGGDEYPNDGKRTFFVVNNGGGGSITVTLTTPATKEGLDIEDPQISVGAGETRYISNLNPATYNNANGRVAVGYSGVTSVTVGAFRV